MNPQENQNTENLSDSPPQLGSSKKVISPTITAEEVKQYHEGNNLTTPPSPVLQTATTELPSQENLVSAQDNIPNNHVSTSEVGVAHPHFDPAPKKSKKLMIILLVILVGVIGGVGYYVYKNQQDSKKPSAEYSALAEKAKDEQDAKDRQDTAKNTSGIKLAAEPYRDPATGATQYYPEGWTIKDNDLTGTKDFNNPVADKASNGKEFNATVYYKIQPLSTTLKDYIEGIKSQRAKTYQKYELISTKDIKTESGASFTLLEEKYMYEGMALHSYKAIAGNSQTAVIITATSLDEAWSKYESVFLQSIVK